MTGRPARPPPDNFLGARGSARDASRRARVLDPAGAAGGDRQLGRRHGGRAGGDHRGLPAGRALRPRARPRARAGLRRPHAAGARRSPARSGGRRRRRSPRRWPRPRRAGKLVVALGGEHTISAGVSRGLLEALGGPLTVVQLDAHSDLRDAYEGSRVQPRLRRAADARRRARRAGPAARRALGRRRGGRVRARQRRARARLVRRGRPRRRLARGVRARACAGAACT